MSLNNKYEYFIDNICRRLSGTYFCFACILIYKLLFDIIFCTNIYGLYEANISILNIISGWIAVIIMAPFIKEYCKQNVSSSIIMIALNLIYFIPITTYCGYGGGSSEFLFFAILYWMIMSILQFKVPIVRFDSIKEKKSESLFYLIFIIVGIGTIYVWWKYTDFRILTNLIDVYEVRSEAANYNMPVVLLYFKQMSTVLISVLILLSIYKKKYISLIILIILAIINFSYAGLKSAALFPIILIGGYIFYRRNMIYAILPIGIILEIFTFIESRIGINFIANYLFRRQGITLAMLSENYYRFFSQNPIDYFRGSILGKLGFESAYNQTYGLVIGNNFQSQTISCNNGLLADVWMGLGYIGILVMPIIVIICFRIFDSASYGIRHNLIIGFSLYFALMFANSTFSTVLLTHGFIIVCIMLLIFPREKTIES